MKIAATYSIIGSIMLTFMVSAGNLIGKAKEKGIGTIPIIFGCIMTIAAWPYFMYIAIKAYLSND